MTNPTMQRFLVLYQIPAAVMQAWMETSPDVRKAEETKMYEDWIAWTQAHSSSILSTNAVGKNKCVTTTGAVDAKNDIVLTSIVEAVSHDAVADMFADHPHLRIPQASIEIMPIRPM
jgi:hypothetical protein